MTDKPSNPHSPMDETAALAIKTDLNLTGVFLQKNIFDSLTTKHGFGARREEPYSFRTAYREHFTGTADIFAAIKLNDIDVLSLVIECKRADVQQKHWVFETREESIYEPLYPFIFYFPPIGIHYSKRLLLPSLGYNREEDFDKAILSFEFKEDRPGKGVLNRNSQENVYKAVLQSYEPLSSILENAQSALNLASAPTMELLYLPIVVTTANLSVMKYSSTDIDRKSGTIDLDKIELIQKPWVYYEFSVPESLRREGRLSLDAVETYRPVKSPVFIVNATAFDSFIECLKADTKRYVLPR